MYYLDTSVLLAYTLAQAVEPQRYEATRRCINQLQAQPGSMVTSFYALHEVFLFALDQAPTEELGNTFGKTALTEILALPVRVLPLLSRTERTAHIKKFAALEDSTDVPHAISAYLSNCRVIVAYDEHFKKLPPLLSYRTPEQLLVP
ncbi:MAG: PIN domain-containing protein [Bdellovibrionota bacterium]